MVGSAADAPPFGLIPTRSARRLPSEPVLVPSWLIVASDAT